MQKSAVAMMGLMGVSLSGCTYEVDELEALTVLDSKAKWTLRTWSDHSNCDLNLDNLTQLTDGDAGSLGDWRPKYSESNFEEWFRGWVYQQPKWVKGYFKSWTNRLIPYCNPSLSLDGIQKLTPHQVKELTRWEGGVLKLNGLEELTPEMARYFVEAPYIFNLFLDGVTVMSNETMTELKTFKGGGLFLAGVRSLATESIATLSPWTGDCLVLGLETLTVEEARLIANMDVNYIGLPRLQAISDEVMVALLEKKKGHYLLGDRDALTVSQSTMLFHWELQNTMDRSAAIHTSFENPVWDTPLCDERQKEHLSCLDLSGPKFYLDDQMFLFSILL